MYDRQLLASFESWGCYVDRDDDRGGGGRDSQWWRDSLLDLLSPANREALLKGRPVRRFREGHKLTEQGMEPEAGTLVILSGRVKVVRLRRGKSRVLAFRGPGDVVGEIGSLSGRPRLGSAIAIEAVTGVWISDAELHEYISRQPSVRDALLRTIVAKLRLSARERTDFDSLDVLPRIAVCLLREAAHGVEDPEGVTVRLTHPDIAEIVGASEPSVQKMLKRLRGKPSVAVRDGRRGSEGQSDEDLVRTLGVEPIISNARGRGRITILRRDVLEAIVRMSR